MASMEDVLMWEDEVVYRWVGWVGWGVIRFIACPPWKKCGYVEGVDTLKMWMR